MKKSIKYDDWLKEKFEKDPELEKEYNLLREKKMEHKMIGVYIKDREVGNRILLAKYENAFINGFRSTSGGEYQWILNIRIYEDLVKFFKISDSILDRVDYDALTIEYETLNSVEFNPADNSINRNITKKEVVPEMVAQGDTVSGKPYTVEAHNPDPNKCDPRTTEGAPNETCSICKQQYYEFDKDRDKAPKVCGYCSMFEEKLKYQIEEGCKKASKTTGKKVTLKPNTLKVTNIDKLYTYNCNKCKKDFETTIEFTNDKRYIKSLRCPDCAFRNIFDTANKKPKIRGIK